MAKPDFILRGHKGVDNASVGPVSQWVSDMPQYARRIEIDVAGATTTIYRAWAPYGSSETAAVWLVQRIVITDSGQDSDITDGIAGGDAGEFGFTWSDRVTHTYT